MMNKKKKSTSPPAIKGKLETSPTSKPPTKAPMVAKQAKPKVEVMKPLDDF